jgi:hypothetical protein
MDYVVAGHDTTAVTLEESKLREPLLMPVRGQDRRQGGFIPDRTSNDARKRQHAYLKTGGSIQVRYGIAIGAAWRGAYRRS